MEMLFVVGCCLRGGAVGEEISLVFDFVGWRCVGKAVQRLMES